MRATMIRKGNVLKIDNTLWKLLVMDHVTPGKGRAHIQTKLRNLLDGTQTEKRFRSDENVEKAFLETKEMQYHLEDLRDDFFRDLKKMESTALRLLFPKRTRIV